MNGLNRSNLCHRQDDGRIINIQTNTLVAIETDLNPLAIKAADFTTQLIEIQPTPAIIAWSGTLADSLFGSNILNWQPKTRQQFANFCSEITPSLAQANTKLLFRPHANHILSDVPSCLTFIKEMAAPPNSPSPPTPQQISHFGLALSPATMLTPAMRDNNAEDHLTRIFEHLGKHATVLYWPDPNSAESKHLPLDLLTQLAEQCLNPECSVVDNSA